jgi:hypothetical protein
MRRFLMPDKPDGLDVAMKEPIYVLVYRELAGRCPPA